MDFADPALCLALALTSGLIAQTIAHHLRIPGIVTLLLAGVLLGPDGLNIIRPQILGSAFSAIVGYAVAVILFEGGLNLNFGRLRRQSVTIQRLLSIGALITMLGGALAVRYLMDWPWPPALLFGTLVIVTGPTVIGPIVRRVKLNRNLHTILEGEGVLIDPIGAIIAVVALGIVLQPSASSFISGLLGILFKLGIGVLFGVIGGYVLARLLRLRTLIPEGLTNVFVLTYVLALFHISNEMQPESGIATVTAAGLIVGNTRTRVLRDLMEFKEGLTVMLIGMLFLLLVADVRLSEIAALGWPGVIVCLVLMFVIRPVSVLFCTLRSKLKLSERAFLAWLAPRGIVAAAVASFFAQELNHAGIPGGDMIRAQVFLVIAATVYLQGLTAALVARLLGVRRKSNRGFAILGANELGRVLGRALRSGGEEVIFLDSNTDAIAAAQKEEFRVVFGNALEERTRQRAELESVAACIGMTQNEEVNLMFVRRAREEFRVPRLLVVLEGHITRNIIWETHATVLFGINTDVDLWALRLRRGIASVSYWRNKGEDDRVWPGNGSIPKNLINTFVPIAVKNSKRVQPVEDGMRYERGAELTMVIFREKQKEVMDWLIQQDWSLIESDLSGKD